MKMIQCDYCKEQEIADPAFGGPEVNRGWTTVRRKYMELHFCSAACIGSFFAAEATEALPDKQPILEHPIQEC